MTYKKTLWKNRTQTNEGTKISAAKLNKIEDGILKAHEKVDNLDFPTTDHLATKDDLTKGLLEKSDITHKHEDLATKQSLTDGLNAKANTSHTHNEYSQANHNHTFDNIEGKPQVYPPATHTHSDLATTVALNTGLDSKANKEHTHSNLVTTDAFNTGLEGKSNTDHSHNNYATNDSVTTALNLKADKATTYTKVEVDSKIDEELSKVICRSFDIPANLWTLSSATGLYSATLSHNLNLSVENLDFTFYNDLELIGLDYIVSDNNNILIYSDEAINIKVTVKSITSGSISSNNPIYYTREEVDSKDTLIDKKIDIAKSDYWGN